MVFELFLTEFERERVSRWESRVEDRSITSRILAPFWDRVVQWVPYHVAPNVLSLAGLLSLMHAYYLCYMYGDTHPRLVSIAAVLLAFAFQTLDAIDGRHAARTKNGSPIGEMFSHVCASLGGVFLMLTLCSIVGIKDIRILWYVVQTAQLVFLQKHFSSFRKGVLRYPLLGGPGEALFLFMIVCLVRAIIGLDWIVRLWPFDVSLYTGAATLYAGVFFYSLFYAITLPKEHTSTRNGLVFCLLYRVFPAVVLHISVGTVSFTSIWDVMVDGVFMSVLTTDIILAKMAQRELHPWVVLMAMLSIFHNLATLMLCLFYFVAVFTDLCFYMHLPMFTINTNVYVCGVYDLCHIGHMRSFENALKLGTRLYVGVSNDEDCTNYKRRPIMTHEERCEAVAACKYVHKVIPNAPLLTPTDFLEKHNIHVVGLSEEYDRPDDIYYADARKMGIAKTLPRTQGMSTSELIRRIKEYDTRKVGEK